MRIASCKRTFFMTFPFSQLPHPDAWLLLHNLSLATPNPHCKETTLLARSQLCFSQQGDTGGTHQLSEELY